MAEQLVPLTDRFERLRGHTPPQAPEPDGSRVPGRRAETCVTRSELLVQRKQQYIDANEARKRAHEEANPMWAATVSAPLSEPKATYNRTLTQLRAERRQDRVTTAVLATGDLLERDKNIMLGSDPTALVTTISRPHAYGPELPMTYVERPGLPTRSELFDARRQDLLAANARTMRQIGDAHYRSFYQRVGDRLDSSLKSYYESQEAGGETLTRGKLIELRKADFVSENEAFLVRHRHGEVRQPNYSDQAEPFWTLGRDVPQPKLSSRAELLEAQRWYHKPETFLPGQEPREPDAFKTGGATRLSDKLSSGPRRFQRGYPAERREITGNIQDMPAPDPSALTTPAERKASVKESLRFLHFKLMADRAGQDFSGRDLVMEQPLYSSFTRDKIFREPARVPRSHTMMPRRREAADGEPSGMTRAFSETAPTLAALPNSSPMLMSTLSPAKPGTAATVRSGGFQVINMASSM